LSFNIRLCDGQASISKKRTDGRTDEQSPSCGLLERPHKQPHYTCRSYLFISADGICITL